ncbi:hypothetical protein GCM10009087_03030 [Sphingomonas oligophenolica]
MNAQFSEKLEKHLKQNLAQKLEQYLKYELHAQPLAWPSLGRTYCNDRQLANRQVGSYVR